MDRQDIGDFIKKRPPMFWWMLANTLAIAFAISAWIICLNLFRDPTHPLSYKWMLKVGRLDPIAAFTDKGEIKLPKPKETFDVTQLEENFLDRSQTSLDSNNHKLKHGYLTNYKKNDALFCVSGNYRILETRDLGEGDFITDGLVAHTQAVIFPEKDADPVPYPVFLDIVFPTSDDASTVITQGKIIELKKNPNFVALLHVESKDIDDGKSIQVTAVALHAMEYTGEEGSAFTIKPPEKANPAGNLPFF